MILPSTIRKIQEKNGTIVRVVWEENTYKGVKIPSFTEYFATERQANDAVVSKQELIIAGACGKYRMDDIPARSICNLTLQPL